MSIADGNIGSVKTLVLMLSSFLAPYGVQVVYGEEFVWGNDVKLPCVVVAPLGGDWEGNGYYKGADPNLPAANTWITHENIQVYCWSAAVDANGRELDSAQPVDHANAVENLRAKVLQAMQGQADAGLMYRPVSGQWVWAGSETLRYGRAYVFTINVDISVPAIPPVDVTVTEVTINPSI